MNKKKTNPTLQNKVKLTKVIKSLNKMINRQKKMGFKNYNNQEN